jgi:crossover junction endodeoxyribonuclease RusA
VRRAAPIVDLDAERERRAQSPASWVEFFVPGPPAAKGRPRLDSRRGHFYTPGKTASYEHQVRVEALRATALARWPKPSQADRFSVAMHLCFADARRRDIDNVAKAILDGMKGVVFLDDFHVVKLLVRRLLSHPRPGALIEVYRGKEP